MKKKNITDATVRKCRNVSILVDKKMQERRIEHDKYIIILKKSIPATLNKEIGLI